MEIYENTIIYVYTPSHVVTGGPNSCHQLCYKLRKFGFISFIYYYKLFIIPGPIETPEEYLEYDNPISTEIIDEPQNIVILPETFAYNSKNYVKARIAIWWLSVDKFYTSDMNNIRVGTDNSMFSIFSLENCYHFTDSEYAKKHLEFFSVPKNRIISLQSYIHPEYIRNAVSMTYIEKNNYVTYNPSKGYAYTMEIIEYCTKNGYEHIKFVPLYGLTQRKISMVYRLSKVHIDFGEFPGREYIPREAAVNDCCVITGLKGASKYYEDVPIPDKYKFEATIENLPKIAECINSCLENYEVHIKDFEKYKQFALGLEETFENNIKDAFLPVHDQILESTTL